MVYNILLVSAEQQHESAIRIHTSPPSWVSLPPASHPSGSSQSTALSFLCYRAGSHYVSALHGSVHMGASPVAQRQRPHLQSRRCQFDPRVRKMPWRRAGQPIPVFLPAESQGQRSLVGCSPYGCKELGMTEATEHTCSVYVPVLQHPVPPTLPPLCSHVCSLHLFLPRTQAHL